MDVKFVGNVIDELSKNRLENSNYKVYFTGESYTYLGQTKKVKDNELMIAIKE